MIQLHTPLQDPLKHAWRECIGTGHAHLFLRKDLQEHIHFLQKTIGYKRVRFHASFHDDVGIYHRDDEGNVTLTWNHHDKIYDFLVQENFDTLVEINPMPADLASEDKTFFWYKMNISPPVSYDAWEDFIRAYALHIIERYGLQRVKNWRFEVWNEPNLKNNFWSGDQQDYFHLYAATAHGLKSVSEDLQVGGPAGAGDLWNIPLAEYCRDENVPLDFISFHGYPIGEKDSPDPPGYNFINFIKKAQQDMKDAGFPNMPLYCTEWSTLTENRHGKNTWIGNDSVSTLYAAAAAAHYAVECDPYIDAFSFWAGSDIFEEHCPHLSRFSRDNQHYGLLSIDGTPKPPYYAFYFLSRMNGPRYSITMDAPPAIPANMIATDETAATRALMWNFHMLKETDTEWDDTLSLPVPAHLKNYDTVRVVTAHIGIGHGSAMEVWDAVGKPKSFTHAEAHAFNTMAQPRYSIIPLKQHDGCIHVPVHLKRDELLFIECASAVNPAEGGTVDTAALQKLDAALNDVPYKNK